jgi:hypothetical protein
MDHNIANYISTNTKVGQIFEKRIFGSMKATVEIIKLRGNSPQKYHKTAEIFEPKIFDHSLKVGQLKSSHYKIFFIKLSLMFLFLGGY